MWLKFEINLQKVQCIVVFYSVEKNNDYSIIQCGTSMMEKRRANVTQPRGLPGLCPGSRPSNVQSPFIMRCQVQIMIKQNKYQSTDLCYM